MARMAQQAVEPENDGIFYRGGFGQRGIDPSFHDFTAQEFSLDPFGGAGYTFRGKTIADMDQVVQQIDSGATMAIQNGVITYTFLDLNHLTGVYNNKNFGFTAGDGLSPFSATQRDAAREAINMWDDLIPQTFKETNGLGADIQFSNSADPGQAYAYYPTKQGWKFQSDVFVADPKLNWTNEWFTPGGYGNTTLVHELGHTLGLSHPGAYNGAAATTYLGQAEYAQDSMQYSIMSYWSGGETGASTVNWTLFLNNYAQTPMLHDIYTVQEKYGADATTRAGDTTYGFNSNAGYDIYDFGYNPFPYMSVYDAGGTDTIDLSGFTASQYLNLAEGAFSSIGAAIPSFAAVNAARAAEGFGPITQASYNSVTAGRNASVEAKIFADTGVRGIVASGYDNFSIAYGVKIENAVGGSNKDVLFGNELDNRLEGRAGDDTLNGFSGNDVLIGGLGRDTLTGGSGNDLFVFNNLETGDRITDLGAGDKIDLKGLGSGLHFLGNAAFDGSNGAVTYSGGVLSVDMNGDLSADFSVTIANNFALQADQLTLI